MVCRAFRERINVVELGIVKNASHVCNGKFRADVVDLYERNTDDQLELTTVKCKVAFSGLPGGSPKMELEQKNKSIPILFIP